jgi:exopolysaccharide biosynthesis polyprenyl glycosylphosphotransferase
MSTQRIRTFFTFSLVIQDFILIAVAFYLAYQLRVNINWPDPLANQVPLTNYASLFLVQAVSIITVLFLNRQYYIPRAASRIDQIYYVFVSVSVGTLMAIALTTIFLRNNQAILDYPRAMLVYSWLLTIFLLTLGRISHNWVRRRLQDRGLGKDKVVVVGVNDTARMIVQRIIWSPQLGYDLVGVINGDSGETEIMGVPILGQPEDLPALINQHRIDEVIVAIPEKGHRETLRVISYCERDRVTIKVFPDLFQYITTNAGIDDLGGLPLLSVRDYALRGYLLTLKRVIDFIGAAFGLVFLSPLMILTAVAIKLESPGPVFFVQPRMGLDGKEFMMIKFRSMRNDAEKDGPGWTVIDDPRQTRLGALLRRMEVDELPNLINVLFGEMSLVGPRPEQAYYVEQFRRFVPRYMDRHREKGGMTGWAQVNGLRGDSSISERTKYDLWYSENWSILLDTKILLRTIWQIFQPKSRKPHFETTPEVERS